MFETILTPMDGSQLAMQAVPYVTQLANAFQARIILMGVCEPGEEEQGEACRLAIENAAADLSKEITSPAASIETLVSAGHPSQQIIDYAEKNKVGIVILTSHGRSGIAPWSLGGTAQKILHARSSIPLLLVKAKPAQEECPGLFNRILVPLDGSKRGEAVLPYVIELSRKFQPEVILFRVIEEGHHVHSIGGLEYVRYLDQSIDKTRSNALHYLEEVGRRFAGTGAKITPEVRVGDAAREILKMADEKADCLIAMASHGHTGIEAWLIGSNTQKVIHATSRPVLLVRLA